MINYCNEISGLPKQVDEVKVSNETPQDTVLVSAEKSTTSPTKEAETPPVVKETKISKEVTLPTVLEVPEEPKTSDDMETDAPQKESNAA